MNYHNLAHIALIIIVIKLIFIIFSLKRKLNNFDKNKVNSITNSAYIDNITGLFSYSALLQIFHYCQAISKKTNFNFSAILIDIDNFKDINKKHSMIGGDRCLKEVSKKIEQIALVHKGFALRFRCGDEFIILLPSTSLSICSEVVEELYNAFNLSEFNVSDGNPVKVTASMTYTDIRLFNDTLHTVSERLCHSLLDAKSSKNCFVLAKH
jgi:diguanylate cyclase (GGDEF)-like protein